MNVFYFLFITANARQREEIFVKEYKFSQTFSGNPFTFSLTSKFTKQVQYLHEFINVYIFRNKLFIIYTHINLFNLYINK